MIKVEKGTVQMQSPIEEMLRLIATENITSKDASLIITGTDLALLFYALVDRYSLEDAMTLWTSAVEAYKDQIMTKGE